MLGRVILTGLFGAVLLMPVANAQVAGQQAQSLPPATVTQFQANPRALLTDFPNGGGDMIKRVRELLSSDRATLGSLISLLQPANEEQRGAIATGLAQVAKAYASSDSVWSNQIQGAVAQSGFPEVVKAYAEVAGDTGTSAAGGGGGGGGGGTGGGGPNTAGAPSGGSNTGNGSSANNAVTTQSSGLTGGTVSSGPSSVSIF